MQPTSLVLPPPAIKALGNAVKNDKWQLWCPRPLYMQPRRGHVHISHTRHTKNDLIYRYWGSYTTASWFDVYTGMDAWIPALPCESAIAYWAIFICSLPPQLLFSLCFKREGRIKPQPIYGSFPSWSNRMIQKHSHMHTNTRLCTCCQKKKTWTEQESHKEKMHVWRKTPVWSKRWHTHTHALMHRQTVTCQLTGDLCLHWKDIMVLWCVLCWHHVVESGALFSGQHAVTLIS